MPTCRSRPASARMKSICRPTPPVTRESHLVPSRSTRPPAGRAPRQLCRSVRLEQLDRVSRGIVQQDLQAAVSLDDVVAEVKACGAQPRHLANEIADGKLDTVTSRTEAVMPVGVKHASANGTAGCC